MSTKRKAELMPDVETTSGMCSLSYQARNVGSESMLWAEGEMRERTNRIPGPWIAETDMVKSCDGR
jgi:hypothetical protein